MFLIDTNIFAEVFLRQQASEQVKKSLNALSIKQPLSHRVYTLFIVDYFAQKENARRIHKLH